MMKHYKCYSLVLCLVLTLSSCGNVATASDSSFEQISDDSSFAESDIAPESDILDSSEEELQGLNWRVDYSVDEFGDSDPSSPYVHCNVIYGEFSNTATQGSKLAVHTIFTSFIFAFRLFKYGNLPVTNISELDHYEIIFKYESGEKSKYTGYISKKSVDLLCIDQSAKEDLITRLSNGETIRVYIENVEYPSEKYLFTFDGVGFADVYTEYETLLNE